ncbi:MAG TPA: putrescine/spermidine ABC transporter ATP-binding protein [Gaiellaceae bacterium]|nr:putrescine/spermidine ABC transporter ATP-binding protein [Gaiellaceae bacterium]
MDHQSTQLLTASEPAAASPDVELVGVTKRFGGTAAVDRIDLQVHPGEFLSLLGPSGCGKTTTLRLIAGFERPDEGDVRIGGRDVSRVPPYRRDVNTVFQSYALFPHLTVQDNVAYGLKQRGLGRAERRTRAAEMLELVRLAGFGERKPRQLSGGQQQRVALARALVMHPRVLLLDEPLGALDLKVRKELQIELKRIQEEIGITFVYVTHDQEEALAMSDRVVVMNAGRIEQIGVPREIYDAPATHWVAGFIGDTNFVRVFGRDVAVRPESVRVRTDGEGLSGRTIASMVIGPAVQCVVLLDDGQEVLAREQRSGGKGGIEALGEGERVLVSWADDEAFDFNEGGNG